MTTGPEDFSGSDYPDPFPKPSATVYRDDPATCCGILLGPDAPDCPVCGSFPKPPPESEHICCGLSSCDTCHADPPVPCETARRWAEAERRKRERNPMKHIQRTTSVAWCGAESRGLDVYASLTTAIEVNGPTCDACVEAARKALEMLPGKSEVSNEPPLPSFAELQEGDWVRIASVNCGSTHEGFFVDCSGELFALVTNARSGNGVLRREGKTANWVITAHKPLRQVVEEMAAKLGLVAKTYGGATDDWRQVVAWKEDARGACADNGHHNVNVASPDERTALLAAKAALEVMIARAPKS